MLDLCRGEASTTRSLVIHELQMRIMHWRVHGISGELEGSAGIVTVLTTPAGNSADILSYMTYISCQYFVANCSYSIVLDMHAAYST